MQQQHPLPQQINQVNVAVPHDPTFFDPVRLQQQDGLIQHNKKRQLNPANKSKNPFLRKHKQTRGPQRSLDGGFIISTSRPVRFERTTPKSESKADIETNAISDSVLPHKKRKATKQEIEIAKGRFTPDSYKGWKPILYPAKGR